jgi:homoserine dehydrogenase
MLKVNKNLECNIALFGFGNIGSRVGELLIKHKKELSEKSKKKINLKHVVVRSMDSINTIHIDKNIFTENHEKVLNDKSINTIVELIGGMGIAKSVIEKALSSGRNVITANKAVIAEYGNKLFELAKKNNVKLFYEASVGGGMPIIETLKEHFVVGKVKQIKGILNGTCNYIMSEMEKGGVEYNDVLLDAQKKGFAEADPTSDIEGFDAAAKISILAHHAFHTPIPNKLKVEREGISGLTKKDFEQAKKEGKKIRLIASAIKKEKDISLIVKPSLIDKTSIFAVTGADNILQVDHEYLGEIVIKGVGAGGYPTSVSVIADIVKSCNF